MRYRFLRFPEGKGKAVTFSYDDGVRQDLRLAELFDRYGLKGTFNYNSRQMTSKLTEEEIKECILGKGHEVAVHGSFHRPEGSLRPIEGIRDVLDCRTELEGLLGRIIRGMAYPDFGITRMTANVSYPQIKQYLAELDIAYCRTLNGDNDRFELPTDWHAWMPTAHHDNPRIMEYIDKFLAADCSSEKKYGATRYPLLLYIWGHSYEFDHKNNWEHMETICEKLSGKDDIWYATNIEICDYVKAYHSLIYSADGHRVYNPTATTVWFDVDCKLYFVRPGEEIVVE